jgi:hypothetical protein
LRLFLDSRFQSKEIEDQMQYFAEEVTSCWRAHALNQVQNPALGLDFENSH